MAMKRISKKSEDLWGKIQDSVKFIRSQTSLKPEIAMVLGTGLGQLTQKVKKAVAIPYHEIPHFPVSTVESHKGQLILGEFAGRPVVVMEGRFHCYEGYTPQEVSFPVRVMKMLGAKLFLVTNACGGLNLEYRKGELVLIEDMINFTGLNPLVGPNDERLGPRFPDMCAPFSGNLMTQMEAVGRKLQIPLRRGVYIGVLGPNLETKAEYRMMRNFGADTVGMSTVPEVITAVHMGMDVLGISVVTDLCDPDHLHPVNIQEIIKTANQAGPKLDRLIENFIQTVKL